jgi:hypothetical protein
MAGNRKKLQGAKSGEFGWVRDDSHVDFGQKFTGEKGSARR